MVEFEIWCDNLTEGKWLKGLVPGLMNVPLHKIKHQLTRNPSYIQSLLKYDRPDNIIVYRNKPILMVEKTEDTPSGHRAGQRFARFVNASEEDVPSVYFVPKTKWKEGDGGPRNFDVRTVKALLRMMDIHQVPSLTIFWPVDQSYEVIKEDRAFAELRSYVNRIIEFALNGGAKSRMRLQRETENIKRQMEEYVRTQPIHASKRFNVISTRWFIQYLKGKKFDYFPNLNFLGKKRNTLLYIAGTKAKPIRSDPYAGYLLVLDYYHARKGISTSDPIMNIAIEWPYASYAIWAKKGDERIMKGKRATKEVRICHHFSDVIILRDRLVLGEAHSSQRYV